MDAKMVTAKYRASQWMNIIKDRLDSGLNVKNYCQERGISRHAYYYWQRKLREEACTELIKQEQLAGNVPSGWAQLTPDTRSYSNLIIEVNGCHIDVDHNTDLELLKNVCRSLRAL